MSLRRQIAALASIAFLLAPMAPALADTAPVTVKVNMARILRITSPAATVIIGNPGVADVTIQDPQTLVLTGKSYGQTNLIVLDTSGNPIADTLVEVVQDQGDVVTVFMGDKRTSLACTTLCQPMVMMGDETSYSAESVAGSQILKSMSKN